jgi:hypothetical protein
MPSNSAVTLASEARLLNPDARLVERTPENDHEFVEAMGRDSAAHRYVLRCENPTRQFFLTSRPSAAEVARMTATDTTACVLCARAIDEDSVPEMCPQCYKIFCFECVLKHAFSRGARELNSVACPHCRSQKFQQCVARLLSAALLPEES